jgi:putative ABC transport system substrate-binding protein
MKRREFITLLGSAAAGWPLAARAQQPKWPVIGFLSSGSPDLFAHLLSAFQRGLAETGYVEGRNVTIEYRWAQGVNDRLPALAADLVGHQVNVIVANAPASPAAKAATGSIPIVFLSGFDPVEIGLVTSLSRPGGNVTGITGLGVELGPKRLELLHEVVPAQAALALLINPGGHSAEIQSRQIAAAAYARGLNLHVLHASAAHEFDAAFKKLLELRLSGLVISADAYFNSRATEIAALALRHAVPAIYQYREFAASGGLMSYGGSLTDTYRQVGVYSGRVLKGEKPADLPVQQATKVELIVNLKTAKTLGLEMPPTLLARADEVIE